MCNLEMKQFINVGMLALLLSLSVPSLATGALSPTNDEVGTTAAEPTVADGEPGELAPAKPAKTKKARRAPADTTGTPSLESVVLDTATPQAPPRVPGVEHVLFERRPVTAVVEIGRERLVHFPFEVAIHKPEQTEGPLDVQLIGNTAYLNAKTPMAPLRLVAEGLDGQGMIPIDVVVRAQAPGVPVDLEIQLARFAKADGDAGTRSGSRTDTGERDDDEPAPPDLVQLSRYCAQMLYAPQRLIKPLRGVRQIDVRLRPVANLYRGGALITTPIGAWRAGTMYVTAVRFTNRTTQAVELDMDQLRGHWTAATPQHWRLLPQGSEADTTAVCLISEQAFDAARP